MDTSEEDISVQYGAQCAVLQEDRPMDNTGCTSLETRDEHKDNNECNVDCNPNKEISLDSGYFSTSEICSNLDESFEKSVKDSDNQPRNDECLGGKKGNSELSSDKATDDEWKDESGLCSSEDSMRGQSTFHTNKNPPMKLDKERTLFADEKTSEVQKEESNADDDDEDDPFYLSIRMLAKLPMIASKPRFKTGSITENGFQPRVKPLYGKPENKVTIPNNDVPPLDKPKSTPENAEGAGRGRIMSTGHALPPETLTSASAKGKSKIVVKESKDPKKEKSESGKKKKKKKK